MVLVGCGDDEARPDTGNVPPIDAPVPIEADATPGDPDASTVDLVARGDYLVNHVAACSDCHTPRMKGGAPDPARFLAGVDCFIDIDPANAGFGCLHTRNLTNDPTGLMNRSDAEIKQMFQGGVRPNGDALHPVMPYWVFANMTEQDADAVVAYLRTVTGVDHTVGAQEAPFDNVPAPATAIDPTTIPAAPAGDTSAERGRYLSSMAGLCLECHTVEAAPGGVPIDMTQAFQGGKVFPAALFGLPTPPFPEMIYTANVTPHPTSGIGGKSLADVVAVLKQGVDPAGDGVCPPMPAGPMGAYGGLTDEDANDIATYLLSLDPVDNAVPNGCAIPAP